MAMRDDLDELFVASSSEADAVSYLALSRGMFWRLVSCGVHLDGKEDGLYAHVWQRKAMIARLLSRRQGALAERARSSPEAGRALAAWNDKRRELARLLLADPEPGEGSSQRITQLSAEKERLERQLADALPGWSQVAGLQRSSHHALLDALPERVAVLDFTRYSRREQDRAVTGNAGLRFTTSYVGFVLARGTPVRCVDLGPAAAIDGAVQEWREAIVQGQASAAAGTLRRLVWEPMARHLPVATRTVLLVPDGLLTAIPWAALPGERPGTFLVEENALAVAPHAPFVLDLLTTPRRPDLVQGTLLAVGGMPGSGPGAVHELETVVSLARPRRIITLQGEAASMAAVLQALPQARWAHFDTHGFFATPEVQSLLQVGPDPLDRLGRKVSAPLARNPLVLSGLELGGKTHGSPGAGVSADDHEILSAEAIAGLPLENLDLAVLSACETGLGTVAGGEGVFGLQRAFHLAGTQTVLASLWSVEVSSTRTLMAGFYQNLWTKHLSRLEALRQAQLAMIQEYRRRSSRRAGGAGHPEAGGAGKVPDPLPPLYWAAFVLSGDWR